MTILDTRPATERANADPDEDHLYCCDPDVSLCGLDISDLEDVEDDDEPCCPLCLLIFDLDVPCGPDCAEAEVARYG